MIDLVTITYSDDLDLMKLQAESIGKYLEPCNHWIVINQFRPDINFWYDQLGHYYRGHNLQIIKKQTKIAHAGSFMQQLEKLAVAQLIKRDYLILDSKNFFIKPCNLSVWDDMVGNGDFTDDLSMWNTAINQYASKLKRSKITRMPDPNTPYKIKVEPLLEYLDKGSLYEDLFVPGDLSSEFTFYAYLAKEYFKDGITPPSVKIGDDESFERFKQHYLENIEYGMEKYYTMSVFAPYLKTISDENLKVINDFLIEREFTNLLKRKHDTN